MVDLAKTPGPFAPSAAHPLRYVYVATRDKLIIVAHWLAGKRNGVSAGEMLRYLLRKPLVVKGKGFVESIESDGDLSVLQMRGVDLPIYYPKGYDLASFYINACSFFFPDDWHYYEVQETEIVPGDIVLDCGAADGLFSMMVAGRCERVYAIEPLPPFIDALERTFEGLDNVKVMPLALSDRVGEATIIDAGPLSSIGIPREGASFRVKTSTVDKLFYDQGIPVSFIKADLEGHELLMLKGAENTLRKNAPRIAITTYHRKEHADSICRYLKSIDHRYQFRTKGINQFGTPFMLHAWVD
jgi:FkbM family methyltransferase